MVTLVARMAAEVVAFDAAVEVFDVDFDAERFGDGGEFFESFHGVAGTFLGIDGAGGVVVDIAPGEPGEGDHGGDGHRGFRGGFAGAVSGSLPEGPVT